LVGTGFFYLRNSCFIVNLYLLDQGAVNFALMMSQMEGGCPVDYNTITDLFLQVSFVVLAYNFFAVVVYKFFVSSNSPYSVFSLCNLVSCFGLHPSVNREI
jgi:hypothetical protein